MERKNADLQRQINAIAVVANNAAAVANDATVAANAATVVANDAAVEASAATAVANAAKAKGDENEESFRVYIEGDREVSRERYEKLENRMAGLPEQFVNLLEDRQIQVKMIFNVLDWIYKLFCLNQFHKI